jgi:hypothetical protein
MTASSDVPTVRRCPLPYASCPLPSALCPLPSALCPLPAALCPLPAVLCPLPSVRYPLPSALSPLPSARCPLPSALCPFLHGANQFSLPFSILTAVTTRTRVTAVRYCSLPSRLRLDTRLSQFKHVQSITPTHCANGTNQLRATELN